ncbi:hypothetical protein [Bdellovibrio sp. ArHS]|uniref:hypothetical protein n=1 Tax=Bdellovibrio sp. ArHS TaxID=1569284 RepID=UPI0025B8BA32|nr:hypothetical protein [Bdellovibrio sp. ArHS]
MKPVRQISHLPFPEFDERGQGIVQLLMAFGLLGFLATVSASVVVNQQREFQFLEQKANSLDLKNQLMLTFQNPDLCTCQLNPDLTVDNWNDANLRFNANREDGSESLNLRRIRAGCSPTDGIIVRENQVLSSGLIIDKVQVTDLRPTSYVDLAGNKLEWMAKLTVSFKPESSRRALKPISFEFPVQVDTSKPKVARTVSSCVSANASVVGYVVQISTLNQYMPASSPAISCPEVANGPHYFFANTACSRWCRQDCSAEMSASGACRATNAGPEYPMFRFTTGVLSECNAVSGPPSIRCTCFK